MFRKAQLRLFGIITGILVIVFAAVLVAVNVITKTVSQRQSMKVLEEIAQGVEYDDNTSTFTFIRDKNHRNDPFNDMPPEKPTGDPGNDGPYQKEDHTKSTDATTKEEKRSDATTKNQPKTDASTGAPTDPPTAQPDTEGSPTENSATEAPQQNDTQAPQTDAPTQQQQQKTEQPTEAPKETQDQQPATVPPVEPPTMPQWPPYEPPERPDDWGDRPPHDDPFGPRRWSDYSYNFYSDDVDIEDDEADEEYYSNELPCYMQPWYRYSEKGTDEAYQSEENTETAYDNEPELEDTADTDIYDGQIVQLAATTTAPPEKNNNHDGYGDMGMMQHPMGEEVPKSLGSIDFFIVMADENGQYLSQLNNDDLDQSVAQQYIDAILKEDAESGMVNNYQFYRLGKDNGTLMVFTDKTGELAMLKQLFRTTVIIGIISLVVLSAVAYFISLKIMQPLKTAFVKQKQFISDASHELKTPLTVISANADVLSGEIGDNKWLQYIKSQTEKMNLLVNDLLNLTRLENNTSQFERTDFDLSKAINNTALPFECRAFETHKKFELHVEDGITVNGSERHIKQMAAIFIDNALKYSNENGTVIITLKKLGDKKVFSVYNTGTGIRDDEKEKIFERFYRSDDSRTHQNEGGYGLGLPIAKSIIDKHKFKLSIENVEGKSICFIVTMP